MITIRHCTTVSVPSNPSSVALISWNRSPSKQFIILERSSTDFFSLLLRFAILDAKSNKDRQTKRERGCIKGPNLVHFHCNDRRLISAREIFRPLHSSSVTEGRRARRRASEREKERAVAHRSIRGRSIRPREGGGRAERGKARRDYPSNFFSQVRHDTQMSAGGEEGGSGSGFNGAAWSTPLKSMNYETTH